MAATEEVSLALAELTADIASAYVRNNRVAPDDLPALISSIFGALTSVGAPLETPAEPLSPAVSIKKSVTNDYLICLEDGLKYKSLKRHLRTKYNLSPEAYRERWGLRKSYPMVAPAYAAFRSNLAKQMGLGRSGSPSTEAKPATKSAQERRVSKA